MEDMTFIRLCSQYVYLRICLEDKEINQQDTTEIEKEVKSAFEEILKYCFNHEGYETIVST